VDRPPRNFEATKELSTALRAGEGRKTKSAFLVSSFNLPSGKFAGSHEAPDQAFRKAQVARMFGMYWLDLNP
jgi:hypothetical protein